jgi:ketosteroid isomerase-like protein
MFAEDVVWHATARTPWRGTHRGRRAVLDFLARIGESMEVFDARLDDLLASESRVSMLFHISARSKGRALEADYQLLARIDAGSVAEIWTTTLDPDALEAFFGA